MKKFVLIILTCLILTSGKVMAENDVAVVDLQKIVDNSTQVQALKREHENKINELNKIILSAQKEIEKENDINKMMVTEEKFRKEFNEKKAKIDDDYSKKLLEIENSIKKAIQNKAKEKGYEYVFAKSVLLYGGDDLTNEVLKSVK